MKLVELGLSANEAAQLVRGIAESQYNLLLGAGFSMSATDHAGRALPSGPGLSHDINRDFSLGFEDSQAGNLPVVFDEARHLPKDQGAALARYLKRRFTRTRPTWHGKVLDLPFERIWTLNIDDLFDQIKRTESREFAASAVNWTDDLAPPKISSGNVQIVHLHGRAASLGESCEGIIFALREYAKAVRSRGDWHSEFWNQWLQRPFLVVGARLVDEFDLAEALTRGTVAEDATGFPTIAVVKGLSAIDERRLRRGHVIPIDADAQQFFDALTHEIDCYRERHAEISRSVLLPALVARFNQQFAVLAEGRSASRRPHDFYGGDEPEWQDIASNLDAPRQVTDAAFRSLAERGGSNASGVILFTGDPGAGRTTALYRVGQLMIRAGYRVFKFRELDRPDVEAVAGWLKANPKTFLLFDNAADFAGTIGEILIRCKAQGAKALIAVAERSRRASILEQDLRADLIQSFELGQVNRPDALSIAKKRDSVARLGIATGWSEQKLWYYFKREKAGDLFMALSGLEQGRGFFSRIDAEWRAIAEKATKAQLRALYAIALVHRFGYSLPARVALDIAGNERLDELGFFESPYNEVVVADARGLRYRHRMLAEHVYRQHVPVVARYDISLDCVKSLAPLVSPSSMRQRTYPVLVLRQVMDKDSVVSNAGSVELARSWYEALRADFDWNGRYWDQRALLESDAGHHDRAYSYAKKSVSVHRHAFSLNTLGRVRLKAAADPLTNLDEAWVFFKEGVSFLQESVAHARGFGEYYEHPFVTLFNYVAEMAARLGKKDARVAELDQMRREWEIEVARHGNASELIGDKMKLAREKVFRALV